MVSAGFHYRRLSLFFVLLLLLAPGCASRNGGNRLLSGGIWPWSSKQNALAARQNSVYATQPSVEIDESPDELKNPEKLHLSYARWQHQEGNLQEAEKSYRTALEHNPKSVDAIIGLARLDQLAGRLSKAEHGFHQALKINPNNAHALDALGQFYASQKRWNEAVETLNKAMIAAPHEPAYRFHLAVALARSGQINRAMPHFVKTVGEAEAHFNAGYILYENGNLPAARAQLTQAVLKKPELTQAQLLLDEVTQDTRDQMIGSSAPAGQSAPAPVIQGGERRSAPPAHNEPQQRPAVARANRPAANPAQGAGWYPTPDRTRTASGPSTGHTSLSPEQLEQMRNQSNR